MRLPLAGVRHALIVAPHPDDEVIAAAALIAVLKARGSHVAVVIVSDGAASHPGSRRWPRGRLIAERRRESLRALRRLGVFAGDVRFLGLPDGAVHDHATTCRRRLRNIALAMRADLIVGPAMTDSHPDHRAVARALRTVRSASRRLSYQVWPARGRERARTRYVRVPGGCMAKRSLIAVHRTQLGAIRDDPAGFSIAPHELAAFAHPVEAFVEAMR
ncbi:PIG-L family deacetylase [Sphingomonadaceae bacterium OTU29LAMAA1]|nr:PIG-L family deacetylase [Sphingomonadaceae bacterium OTU29LAMAA1]